MSNTLVDWYRVKDPHPAAVPNLNKLVDYMVNNHYTNNLSVVTPYRLAKELNRQQKQITMLIANRPGFVQVTRNGKSVGYYWDRASLGGTYPNTFAGYRGKPLISVEAIEDVNKEAAIALAKENGKQMQEAAKEIVRETRKPAKPDFIFPTFASTETIDRTARFSLLPNEIAKDLIQTSARALVEDGLNEDALVDMATALFSLLAHTKTGE